MQPPAILAPIVDLVFPPRCPLCGEGLSAQAGLCGVCWSTLAIPGEPCCSLCQRPLPDLKPDSLSGAGVLCAPCMAAPPAHDGIAAGTLYTEPSRQLVLALKYGRKIALAPMLSRMITPRLGHISADWLVTPVPLHRWRLWQRGFNQAALLAREIARQKRCRLVPDLLLRTRATPKLGGLGARARAKTMAGAIAANPRRANTIKGASIVLVDDVLTSGATSNACVAALKRAGAARVVIACFARVLDEAL